MLWQKQLGADFELSTTTDWAGMAVAMGSGQLDVAWIGPYRWLSSMLRGHYGYYGMPHNYPALGAFHQEVRRLWFRTLRRRSQKARRLNWDAFKAIVVRFPLPLPRITHPWTGAQA